MLDPGWGSSWNVHIIVSMIPMLVSKKSQPVLTRAFGSFLSQLSSIRFAPRQLSEHGLFSVSARVNPRQEIAAADNLSFSRRLQDRLSGLLCLALAAPLENL